MHPAWLRAQPARENVEAERKLGVVLMGLGLYSTGELAPALEQTKHCRLAGVITGDPQNKGRAWSRRHGFPEQNIFSYDTIDRIAGRSDIDIIYVVTPPGLHRDHVLAAAAAGKHVICEKPMANSVAECDEMIAACRAAHVKLSIGYRLVFDPHHQLLDQLARSAEFGPFTKMSGGFGFNVRHRSWRLSKPLGGGPLMDVGIYVIQAAARAAGGVAPVAATARELPKKNPELFNEVEETLDFTLEFADGATCEGRTSFAEGHNRFRAESTKGWFELQPAYSYRGVGGATSRGPIEVPRVNQQALQMDDFAQCILADRASPVPGELGRQHLAVIEAIHEAARTGRRVAVRK